MVFLFSLLFFYRLLDCYLHLTNRQLPVCKLDKLQSISVDWKEASSQPNTEPIVADSTLGSRQGGSRAINSSRSRERVAMLPVEE